MLIPRGRANKGFEGAGERAIFGYAGSHRGPAGSQVRREESCLATPLMFGTCPEVGQLR